MHICFWDNRLLDKWPYGPMGHFWTIGASESWAVRIMGIPLLACLAVSMLTVPKKLHKVQLRLIGMWLVLQVFGLKLKIGPYDNARCNVKRSPNLLQFNDHEYLYQISWQSIQWLLRYFNMNHNGELKKKQGKLYDILLIDWLIIPLISLASCPSSVSQDSANYK